MAFYKKGYILIPFLVVMTMVTGALSTSLVLLWQLRDVQELRIQRLHAEALVLSAWSWRSLNQDAALPVFPAPFSPTQVRTAGLPALDLPLSGQAYLVQSGSVVWAIGIYEGVMEFQSRSL